MTGNRQQVVAAWSAVRRWLPGFAGGQHCQKLARGDDAHLAVPAKGKQLPIAGDKELRLAGDRRCEDEVVLWMGGYNASRWLGVDNF